MCRIPTTVLAFIDASHIAGVEAGMAALRAATIEPARMLGAEDELGSPEVGKYADIVATSEDPTADIIALRTIVLVIKGGRVYRNSTRR